MESPYNVPIETDTLPHLVQEARDWIWSHGGCFVVYVVNLQLFGCLRFRFDPTLHLSIVFGCRFAGVLVRKREKPEEVTHAPFVLLPTPFLRPCFHQACDVQRDVALLLHKVAYDHDFLSNTLEQSVSPDSKWMFALRKSCTQAAC